MSSIACGSCGACLAHCPTCGHALEAMTGIDAPVTAFGCTYCSLVLAYCTTCAAFLYPPPAADRRRPCWKCRGRGQVTGRYLLVESGIESQLFVCEGCNGTGLDPVGKAEPA